eukprot:scaffold41902_cov78-Skeletonema_dohrnii-CCMP3373.AAC.1
MSVTEVDRLFRFHWGLIFRITTLRAGCAENEERHLVACSSWAMALVRHQLILGLRSVEGGESLSMAVLMAALLWQRRAGGCGVQLSNIIIK